MNSIKSLFKIEMDETAEAFQAARMSDNSKNLRLILILFAIIQVVFASLRFGQLGKIVPAELIFFGVCIFMTITIGLVIAIGKEIYFRVGLFLTMFLAAIYSWYGILIDFGQETYLLILILTAVFIIDAEGYRASSALSAVVYIYAAVTQHRVGYIPDGRLVTGLVLLFALWYYTEHRHKKEIFFFNKNNVLKKQHDQLEREIAYRDALTERLMESEHKFRVFMNHVPVSLIVLDDGEITYANKSAVQLTGYSREELERTDWIDIIDFEDALMLENAITKQNWEPGTVREYFIRIIHKSKTPIWTRLVVTDLKFENRNVLLISGYDITDQKHYESQLSKLVRMKEDMLLLTQSILGIDDMGILFDIILDGAIDSVEMADRGSILIKGEDGRLRAEAYRGYDNSLMDDFSIPIEETFLYLKTGGHMRTTEIINDISRLDNVKMYDTQTEQITRARSSIGTPIYRNGELYGMVYLDSPIKNAFKEEDFMMVDFLKTQIEMAINKQSLLDEAIYLSRYDKLTGIFNRRWFEEYYQTMETKAQRYDDAFALVMFDLNGLKQVNDSFGHLEGDAMIKGFTSRLKDLTRSSDVLARFGGDEFVGIFHEIDEINLKRRMAEFTQDLLDNPIETSERNIHCRFSYGAAYFKKDSDDYETLVKIADERMYALKAEQEKTYVVNK